MGVVKTASESILEEAVVPSEEANYSVQGHAGKLIFIFRTVRLFGGVSVRYIVESMKRERYDETESRNRVREIDRRGTSLNRGESLKAMWRAAHTSHC